MFTVYRGVFTVIQKLSAKGPVDVMDVVYNLAEEHRHLVSSMDAYTSASWQVYHKAIFDFWAKDQTDRACKTALEQSYPANLTTLEELSTAMTLRDSGARTVSVGDLLEGTVRTVMARKASGGKIPGLGWGLPLVDSATLGGQSGQLIFIGGRPGDGKSALGWQMARFQAHTEKVGWITMEDSKEELMIRGLAAEGQVDSRGLMTGDMDNEEFAKMKEGVERMAKIKDNLFIHEKPGMKLPQLHREIRAMARRGCKIIYLDYIQLPVVAGDAPKHQKVGEVSTTVKALARELGIPIVALGQLKRPEGNDRAPTLADIQHSDQPGQDSDQAWFLWHKTDKEGKLLESWLIIRKARNGAPRWVRIEFHGPTLTFRERLGQ
jgi:replicative DNA helicase